IFHRGGGGNCQIRGFAFVGEFFILCGASVCRLSDFLGGIAMRTTQRRKIEPARVIIGAVLLLVGLICLLPLIHIVAMSMSSSTAISTDTILLWPKDFTLAAYKYSL